MPAARLAKAAPRDGPGRIKFPERSPGGITSSSGSRSSVGNCRPVFGSVFLYRGPRGQGPTGDYRAGTNKKNRRGNVQKKNVKLMLGRGHSNIPESCH